MNDLLSRIKDNVSKVIIGKEHVTGLLLAALAAGGHVLLEDVPGTGKSVLVFPIIIRRKEPLSSRKDLSLPTCFWRTRSTVPRPEPSPACWNAWARDK